MNRLLTALTLIIFGYASAYAQCTPPASTGTFVLTPATDDLDCIEQGVAYSDTLFFENLDDIAIPGLGAVAIDFLRFDSLTNLPCGIEAEFDRATPASYTASEEGCLRIFGTSTEAVGQYRIGIYISVSATVPVVGTQSFSGEASDVIDQIETLLAQVPIAIPPLPVSADDFKYWLRVTAPAGACNPADQTGNSDLTASNPCLGPGQFIVNISGNTEVCPGQTTALTANPVGNGIAPYTYAWSSSQTTAAATVGAGTVTVTVTDDAGTSVTATATVTESAAPSSGFSFSAANDTVTFTNSSTGGVTYEWDFGDGTNSSMENPASAIVYGTADTFTVTLIATNACGTSDTSSLTIITTLPVGIFGHDITNTSIAVYPNPGNGLFNIRMDAGDINRSFTMRVLTVDGREVYSEDFIGNGGMINRTLSVGEFGKGIYLLYVQSEGLSAVRKLVVQ